MYQADCHLALPVLGFGRIGIRPYTVDGRIAIWPTVGRFVGATVRCGRGYLKNFRFPFGGQKNRLYFCAPKRRQPIGAAGAQLDGALYGGIA